MNGKRDTFLDISAQGDTKTKARAGNSEIKQGRMIEGQGNTLKHASKRSKRESKGSLKNTRRNNGNKQEPEKARVSHLPL